MTGRGETKVIRDPAVAIAAGKCWIARWGSNKIVGGLATDTFHPEDCVLCEFDAEYLVQAIDEFLDWSNLRERDEPQPLRKPVEAFLGLTAEAQARAVAEAQGYST